MDARWGLDPEQMARFKQDTEYERKRLQTERLMWITTLHESRRKKDPLGVTTALFHLSLVQAESEGFYRACILFSEQIVPELVMSSN